MLEGFFIRVLGDRKPGFETSEILAAIVKRSAAQFDVLVKDASDYHAPGKITDQVTQAIVRADVVFADGNSSNENVWYEIGFADYISSEKVILTCLAFFGPVEA